jgi:UDP-glucose 4-epimerase
MRLLVIGCLGFLGRAVSEMGAQKGAEVLGISRSRRPPGWRGKYVQTARFEDLHRIMQRFEPDAVLHAVGPTSVDSSFIAPLDDLHASVVTWAQTLDAARRSGLRPLLIFPSSAAVYGDPQTLQIAEETSIAPISPYGFHKATCELLALEYSKLFGIPVVVCRFFSLFGASQRRLLIWELYEQLVAPHSIVWLGGKGNESRDYLEVHDAASAVIQLITHLLRDEFAASDNVGQRVIVNIASGKETNVLSLAEQLRDMVAPEKRISCRRSEMRGRPERWCADINRLRSLIPHWTYKPLSVGLSECVAAWQNGENAH